jgi:hypothetical protein
LPATRSVFATLLQGSASKFPVRTALHAIDITDMFTAASLLCRLNCVCRHVVCVNTTCVYVIILCNTCACRHVLCVSATRVAGTALHHTDTTSSKTILTTARVLTATATRPSTYKPKAPQHSPCAWCTQPHLNKTSQKPAKHAQLTPTHMGVWWLRNAPGATPSAQVLWSVSPASGTSVWSSNMRPPSRNTAAQFFTMAAQSSSENALRKCFITMVSKSACKKRPHTSCQQLLVNHAASWKTCHNHRSSQKFTRAHSLHGRRAVDDSAVAKDSLAPRTLLKHNTEAAHAGLKPYPCRPTG